ncbi:hypothetical protein IEQ34_005032 [Dendrobium chrysotoxum]|uniref:lipid IVA 3-deoxy-D-manno-octulosonic acid transferase n=1 Tax=Dendrobium chrysotoxum TaxID=161865 RepID=A0AAV7HB60_DENCH|nr:hypothetical protein IEQ34_005032 [Dendrobium chrysotoxum]
MSAKWGWAIYDIYRAASRAIAPFVYLHIHWRRLRGLEHRSRWMERFGRPTTTRPPGPLIWFHAVSLGEGLAAIPVIKHCLQEYPNVLVLMTTTTVSAFEVIKDKLPNSVIYQFAPIDTPMAMENFLVYWSPVAVILMESELWPNLIISASRKGIAVALLNARMSYKSFKRWSLRISLPLIALMLSKFSLIVALSTTEAVRYQLLNAPPFIINFAGDLKYGKYMECNFSSNRPSKEIMTLGDQIINKSTCFRYLGSIIQSDGKIDGDIISRIQVGCLKWRNGSGLLCDRKVPLKLKGKFYKMVVIPEIIYGAECWPLKEKHNTKLSVAEMRMLSWMSGFTLRDRIRNEHIREKVGVAPVEDKIRESRLRWFGHIKQQPSDDPVRKVEGNITALLRFTAVGGLQLSQRENKSIEGLKLQLKGRPVWMAASIHSGETEVMISVHNELARVFPNLVTILVTRHPQHGQQLVEALQERGMHAALRSRCEMVSPCVNVYVVDTLGELGMLYRVSSIAVIGGSFQSGLSGHNFSEAAAAGCAVLTGPHLGHFSRMLAEMKQVDYQSVLQVRKASFFLTFIPKPRKAIHLRVEGKLELVKALKQLLSSTELLESHQRSAKLAFSAVSNGVVQNVWNLVDAQCLQSRQALG